MCSKMVDVERILRHESGTQVTAGHEDHMGEEEVFNERVCNKTQHSVSGTQYKHHKYVKYTVQIKKKKLKLLLPKTFTSKVLGNFYLEIML